MTGLLPFLAPALAGAWVGLLGGCLGLLGLGGRMTAVERRTAAAGVEWETSVAALRQAVEGLAAQTRETREPPPPESAPMLRAGMNLNKRSQALRLHRRGDRPGAIARQLQIPLQEVELLLKVHEIVMRGL